MMAIPLHALPAALDRASGKLFLSGPPGSGKTSLAVNRLRWLVQHGMPATSILVLVPQRLSAVPFLDTLRDPELGPAGQVDVVTFDGMARRVIELYWPLIGDRAGFAHPTLPPVLLNVETAQYFMDMLIAPLIDEDGYFGGVTIERTRLVGQLLDNLNKAALIGIPLDQVPARLKAAWGGDAAQRPAFDQAGECVQRFRDYCLQHNLLDFSLQIETFARHLSPQPAVRAYLFQRYRHLIVDNLEEDTPVMHDLLIEWVKHSDSAWLVFDQEGGHRTFLGADPGSGARLAEVCDEALELTESRVAPPDVLHLADQIGVSLRRRAAGGSREADFRSILHIQPAPHRFHPQMLEWVVGEVGRLVHEEGVRPDRIVILAPFVGDALRFALLTQLSARAVPARSHRPSRSLRDEPAVRCMLTLARLAHPPWKMMPLAYDVTLALTQAIGGMDLVRAHLLASIVYRGGNQGGRLAPFGSIEDAMRQRIGVELGTRYEILRSWLESYQAAQAEEETPIDHCLGRLFGEVLSQPGFGFHRAGLAGPAGVPTSPYGEEAAALAEAGRIASELIESARKFRQALELVPQPPDLVPVGARFVRMVERGVLAATYVASWQLAHADAVLLAPAYTYLMTNRPVDYQFWLDAGSLGWWERIYQPLTHPYVLRRDWQPGRLWSDEDEFEARQDTLWRLILGLVRRCRKGVYLGVSDLNEQGYEQRGPLLQAIQSALRRAA